MDKNWRCGHGWLRGEQCEICNAPKREWQGLTDEEIIDIRRKTTIKTHEAWADTKEFSRAIEAALKERNT